MAKLVRVIQNPEKVDENMILRITQVPIMNDKIVHDIAAMNPDLGIMRVSHIIDFMGRYTSNVVKEGLMETVMLPGFGKFAPNIKLLQSQKRRIKEIKNGKYLLTLALKGRNINFKPQINPIKKEDTDETV